MTRHWPWIFLLAPLIWPYAPVLTNGVLRVDGLNTGSSPAQFLRAVETP